MREQGGVAVSSRDTLLLPRLSRRANRGPSETLGTHSLTREVSFVLVQRSAGGSSRRESGPASLGVRAPHRGPDRLLAQEPPTRLSQAASPQRGGRDWLGLWRARAACRDHQEGRDRATPCLGAPALLRGGTGLPRGHVPLCSQPAQRPRRERERLEPSVPSWIRTGFVLQRSW